MESNDRRQRHSNPQGYAGQSALLQQSSQYPQSSEPDRFRQPTLQQSPTSAPPNRRAAGQQYGSYGYGDGQQFVAPSLQASTLQYPSEYAQDASRPQSQQQYQHYGSSLMYNVPSQQQAASPPSPYDAVQNYTHQPRQSTAIEVLSNQFGVPQQYYVQSAGDSGPTSAPHSTIASQNIPSQYGSLSYAQSSPIGQSRDSLSSAYGGNLPEPSATQSSSAQYGGQSYTAQSGSELDAAYSQYQTELRRTNENVRDGRLLEAGSSLISISDWLLGNAENLGLVRDDESLHADRLRLWEEFNNCWLATLQRQKDLTNEAIRAGQSPSQPQSLMGMEALQNMGNGLVRLCDVMEKHGLVDYQMGIWEEAIMHLLIQCIELQEGQSAPSTAAASGAGNNRRR